MWEGGGGSGGGDDVYLNPSILRLKQIQYTYGGGAIECQRGERCKSGMGKKGKKHLSSSSSSSSGSSSSSSNHLCEKASVITTKEVLLQRLRKRLAQQDLDLMDLRKVGYGRQSNCSHRRFISPNHYRMDPAEFDRKS